LIFDVKFFGFLTAFGRFTVHRTESCWRPRGWDVLRYELQKERVWTTDFMCPLLIISCGQARC